MLRERVNDLENSGLPFMKTEKYGYLSTCPSNLGTAMRASCFIHIPEYFAAVDNEETAFIELRDKLKVHGLDVRGARGDTSTIPGKNGRLDISNLQRLFKSESELFISLFK